MAGYPNRLKQSEIATGNVINASDFNAEFDAIAAAFNTSGHNHDGTTDGEGGPIEKIGPGQQFLTSTTQFYPSSDGQFDLGIPNSNEFKDLYIDGKAYIDGLGEDILVDTAFKIQFRDSDIYIHSGAENELDIVADDEIDIVAPIVDIDASTRVDISGDVTIGDDLTMGSDGAIINFGADNDIVLTHVHNTGLILSSVTTGNLLHLKSTEPDATTTASPILVIERDSASPADDDYCGMIQFKADSDTGVSRSIARIQTQVKDVSNTDEDSEIIFTNMIAGQETSQIILGTGITFGTAVTANLGINVDNFNIDGTTIALSSGDMTLDGAANIIIDATTDIVLDAAGEQIIFKDGSTNVGHIDMTSDNLTLKSLVANKSIIFKGDDAGSEVTALTLDMAEAGDASFGRNVTIGGNLTVSGTTTTINSTVTTIVDPIITLGANTNDSKDRGIEFKYNDGSAKVGFFGYDDSEGKFTLLTAATNNSEVFSGTTGTLVANLEGNLVGGVTGSIALSADDSKITFGANNEIELIHDHNVGLKLKHTATADNNPVSLTLQTGETAIETDDILGQVQFQAPDESDSGSGDADGQAVAASIVAIAENAFSATANPTTLQFKTGSSEAATTKMNITSAGIVSIPADSAANGTSNSIHLGANADLKIYHDGSNSYVDDTGDGALLLNGSTVHLYHGGANRLQTTSGGIAVAGALTATGDITAFFTSDQRLKENVVNIPNALDKVMDINGVEFDWSSEYIETHGGEDELFNRKHQVGVIAQEVEKVLPEVVADRPDGYKAVRYEQLTALLIEAVKELKTELDNHKQGCKCHGST
jgi:hypothetical protein